MSRRISELEKQLSMTGDDRDSNVQELLASRGTLHSSPSLPHQSTSFVYFIIYKFIPHLTSPDLSVQIAQAKDTIVRELAQARQINDRQGIELEQQASKIAALNVQLEAEVLSSLLLLFLPPLLTLCLVCQHGLIDNRSNE